MALGRVICMMTDVPRTPTRPTALIRDVLRRLPLDPHTGKPTTRGISNRGLRELIARAERATGQRFLV
jgi:hypothetical protein